MAVNKYVGEEAIERVASYVNRKLTVVSAIPTSPTELRTILYIGPTTPPPEEYIQGGIYLYDEVNDEWILISTADVDLDDYETSWTGTQAEWNALSADDQAKYKIVNFTDDYTPTGDHVISGYFYQGEFYEEETYTTLISRMVGYVYIDLPYDDLYLYDDEEDAYVLAGGGGADAIVYVQTLPVTNIENVLYGMETTTSFDAVLSDGFLDTNELFVRTDGASGDYTYTAKEGVVLKASEDGTTYKEFSSLAYDGVSDWTLTYEDATTATLADGDTFYYLQKQMLFYAGNEEAQTLTLLGSGGGGSGSTYFAGEGIDITNNVLSVKPATTAALGGMKPDDSTVKVDPNGVLSGNYDGGYGIKVDGRIVSSKTFVGTKEEWDNMTSAQKAKFDTVSITDDYSTLNNTPGHSVVDSAGTEMPQRSKLQFADETVTDDSTNDMTVITHTPYTAGDKIDITNRVVSCDETVKGTFVGTQSEWNSLSTADKAKYDIVNFTDDEITPAAVVDTVAAGNMNPCTSNSVYQAIAEKNKLITILAENSDIDISTTRYQTTVSELSNLLSIYVRGYIGTNLGGNRFCAIIPVPIALGSLDYQIAIESTSMHDISLIVNLTSAGALQIGCSNRQSNKVALTFIKGVKM